MSRSGSQKRKATEHIKVNCKPEQKAAIKAKAAARGVSASALCLNVLLEVPMPHARRQKVDGKLVAQYLASTARVADPLRAIDAKLGKIGSNINQLTHYAHLDRNMAASIIVALEEFNAVAAQVKEALGDVNELRTEGMHALGLEPPNHPGPDSDG